MCGNTSENKNNNSQKRNNTSGNRNSQRVSSEDYKLKNNKKMFEK